ncbi:MAG: rhomboid family intramembrane serine protease [Candidatus Aenigmatarchaeota archaeon]
MGKESKSASVTRALIIGNVAVFLAVFSMPQDMMAKAFDALSFSGASLLEPWRLLTAMFMHASASHLFLNMLALFFFGGVAEKALGARRFAAVYFLSGIAGGLLYAVTSTVPAVGASGCIFGVMGAAMFIKPGEWIRIYVIPLPLGLVAILYSLTQVVLSAAPPGTSGIAYMAHVGGLAAGALLAFYFEAKRSAKGLLMLAGLIALLVLLWPFIGLAVTIGEAIIGVLDFITGIALYGAAKLLLGWVWALVL